MNTKTFMIVLVVVWIWLGIDFLTAPSSLGHACVNGEYYIKRGDIWIKEDQECLTNPPIK